MPLMASDLGDANEDPISRTELEPVRTLDHQIGHSEIGSILDNCFGVHRYLCEPTSVLTYM